MFCQNCGSQIENGTVICPVCNTQLSASMGNGPSPRPVQQPEPEAKPEKTGKTENPKGKGYAAVVSALMAFPTLICLVADYLGPPEWIRSFFPGREWAEPGIVTWSAYLLGIVMCLWMMIVLPAIKPKRPAVTVGVCMAVLSLYLLFLAYINHSAGWYVDYVLPICLMLTVSSAIMSILMAYKVIPAGHIASAIIVQGALLCLGIEILFDMQQRGAINLRWSIILAVAAISAVGIYEAVSYAVRINKK